MHFTKPVSVLYHWQFERIIPENEKSVNILLPLGSKSKERIVPDTLGQLSS